MTPVAIATVCYLILGSIKALYEIYDKRIRISFVYATSDTTALLGILLLGASNAIPAFILLAFAAWTMLYAYENDDKIEWVDNRALFTAIFAAIVAIQVGLFFWAGVF